MIIKEMKSNNVFSLISALLICNCYFFFLSFLIKYKQGKFFFENVKPHVLIISLMLFVPVEERIKPKKFFLKCYVMNWKDQWERLKLGAFISRFILSLFRFAALSHYHCLFILLVCLFFFSVEFSTRKKNVRQNVNNFIF